MEYFVIQYQTHFFIVVCAFLTSYYLNMDMILVGCPTTLWSNWVETPLNRLELEYRRVLLCLWTSEHFPRPMLSSLFYNGYRWVISSLVVHSHVVLSIKYRWVNLSLAGESGKAKRKCGTFVVESHEYWGTGLFVFCFVFLLVIEMNCASVCGYFCLFRSPHKWRTGPVRV